MQMILRFGMNILSWRWSVYEKLFFVNCRKVFAEVERHDCLGDYLTDNSSESVVDSYD